jgi:hypothetical protein
LFVNYDNKPVQKISKSQAKEAAKGLIKEAQKQKTTVLNGSISFSKKGVKVMVSAGQTTVNEESKSEILESYDDE